MPPPPSETDVDMDVDLVEMSDPEPVKPKRQRKPKKVWPLGKNGLRKKRHIRSRMKVDEKGYMGK